VAVERPAGDVYDFVRDPANLPQWASGLGATFTEVDGEWVADSPAGRLTLSFADENEFGVADHVLVMPSGERFHNPMRVLADGDACEVVFTLRRQPGMSDADFARDADAVTADLRRLKEVLEGSPA
jgi:hypothetical protein